MDWLTIILGAGCLVLAAWLYLMNDAREAEAALADAIQRSHDAAVAAREEAKRMNQQWKGEA